MASKVGYSTSGNTKSGNNCTMSSIEERIAHLAITTFESLPTKCKPRTDPVASIREWNIAERQSVETGDEQMDQGRMVGVEGLISAT